LLQALDLALHQSRVAVGVEASEEECSQVVHGA
jgi:hypothetical protein